MIRLAHVACAAAWIAGVSLAPAATAAPGGWDRVAHPQRAKAQELMELAERSRVPREEFFRGLELREALNERAAVMLRMAGASRIDYEPLAYLYADALYNAGDGYREEADDALRRALRLYPDSPLAPTAWRSLAYIAGTSGDHDQEVEAYEHALERQWDRDVRAELLLNRAEAYMATGDLDAALTDYRASMRNADAEVLALARWGAAVALERSFDLPAALEMVELAASARFGNGALRVSALDLPGVYFAPPYEEHYYRALALMSAARREPSGPAAIEKYQASAFLWSLYISSAERAGDARWVSHARRHREVCARQGLLDEEQD